jgi:hypothetical protein
MSRASTTPLVWDTDLPLFSRQMLAQWSLAMLATALVMALLLGTVFAAQQAWDALLPMAAMIGAISGGLWLLGLIIMAVLFRGRYRVRYTLSPQGLRCDTLDQVARKANRLAIGLGAAMGKGQLLGAGLIGVSRESEEVNWSGAFQARFDAARHTILMRNGWRTLLWVQCTPENYAEVAAQVSQHMARRQTAKRFASRLAKGSPLPAYLGRSVLVFLACAPLLPLAETYRTGLFLPIFTLCFALAMVWLINLFGWVVLGGLGLQIGLTILAQFEQRRSFLHPGEVYHAYAVLGGDDFSLFLVAGIGAAILIWLCHGALRGRWLAALVADKTDMGDA